jgi:hypothetical protein
MHQHILDDGVGTFAVLRDLVEILTQSSGEFGDFTQRFVIEFDATESFLQFSDQFSRNAGEIIHEIERVFDFMSNASGELTKRGKLLGVHQAILRGA